MCVFLLWVEGFCLFGLGGFVAFFFVVCLVSLSNFVFTDFPGPLRYLTVGQWLLTTPPFPLFCHSSHHPKSLYECNLLLSAMK